MTPRVRDIGKHVCWRDALTEAFDHEPLLPLWPSLTMAKGSSSAAPKGQKSIASFFGAKPTKSKPEPVSEPEPEPEPETEAEQAESSADEASDVEVDDVQVVTKSRNTAPDSSGLPPIHDIPSIFSDLVSRVPDIKTVAEHLEGRRMRVATMCSGTESPLLALELIRRSLVEHYDTNLEFEHVFSCEIEPFKQAYIERNFKPPLLFRDVCELGDSHAYASSTLLTGCV